MSNDLKEIKLRLFREQRIEELLEKLGCQHVKPEKGATLFTAARPDGDNRRSVQVENDEHLNSYIRSRGITGDIYHIVSHIKYRCFTEEEFKHCLPKSKKWIVDTFGYHDVKSKPKIEINNWLKDIKRKRSHMVNLDEIEENIVINECVKNEYNMFPHICWVEDGITCDTQEEFECGFDPATNRIVVMIRNRYGELIGVKGRTLDEDEDRKYLYLYKMNKSIELYNLYNAKPYIMEQKEILIFEGYKSVMKAWQYGYRNCVSIEGDSISNAQAALIKSLGMDIKIVLCFDKDKEVKEIKQNAIRITNRDVYAIYDKANLLSDKQSPVDAGENTWISLYRKYFSIPKPNYFLYNGVNET